MAETHVWFRWVGKYFRSWKQCEQLAGMCDWGSLRRSKRKTHISNYFWIEFDGECEKILWNFIFMAFVGLSSSRFPLYIHCYLMLRYVCRTWMAAQFGLKHKIFTLAGICVRRWLSFVCNLCVDCIFAIGENALDTKCEDQWCYSMCWWSAQLTINERTEFIHNKIL